MVRDGMSTRPSEALLEHMYVGKIKGSFHVPAYQRGYRWGESEVLQLLRDIWENLETTYYLQPVVVKKRDKANVFREAWTAIVDPASRFVTATETRPAGYIADAFRAAEAANRAIARERGTTPLTAQLILNETALETDQFGPVMRPALLKLLKQLPPELSGVTWPPKTSQTDA